MLWCILLKKPRPAAQLACTPKAPLAVLPSKISKSFPVPANGPNTKNASNRASSFRAVMNENLSPSLQFARIVLTMSAKCASVLFLRIFRVIETLQLTHVVQLTRAGIHSLEQLINLLVAHLLAKVCEDVAELAHANETCELLVEYLETAAVFFRLAGIAETAGAVENALEVVKVDCAKSPGSVFPCFPAIVLGRIISYSRRPSGSRGP